MSSADDSYADFLGKANQDTGSEKAKSDSAKKSGKGGVQLKSVDKGLQVPKKLASVDAVFESEGEEAFEGVALRYEGGKLDSGKRIPVRCLPYVVVCETYCVEKLGSAGLTRGYVRNYCRFLWRACGTYGGGGGALH